MPALVGHLSYQTQEGAQSYKVLFPLVIEPVVWWLAEVDQLYKFHTSDQKAGPAAFADDVVLLTSARNM